MVFAGLPPQDPGSRVADLARHLAPSPELAQPSLERQGTSPRRAALDARLGELFAVHGEGWKVTWDRRADRPHLIEGQGVPLLPGRGNRLRRADLRLASGQEVTLSVAAARARTFLDRWSDLLGTRGLELHLDPERSGGVSFPGRPADERFWNLEFSQHVDGVPVVGARVFVRIVHGNAVQWGTNRVADVAVSPKPGVGREKARAFGMRRLMEVLTRDGGQGRYRFSPSFEFLDRGSLEILPVLPSSELGGQRFSGLPGLGYQHVLVWRFEALGPKSHRYRLRVDAHTGEVVEAADLTVFDDATVKGEVYLDSREDPRVSLPFPFTRVQHTGAPVTDEHGVYDYQGGLASVFLDGLYVDVNDLCGAISLADGVDGNLDLGGSPGTDCSTPGFGGAGNTDAARTVFYHVTVMRQLAAQYFPDLPWLDRTLVANTNVGGTCNAFWNGVSINFFPSTNFPRQCRNLGEVPGVVKHEWGHGFDDNTGGLSFEKGSGEAFGDTFDMLTTRSSCYSAGTFTQPCATCGPTCTGGRDPGAVALGGSRTLARPDTIEDPEGIHCARFSCPYYSGAFPYQGPMGYEGHCESLIGSAANWDLAQELVGAYGEEGGWQVMNDLWFASVLPAQSMFQVVSGGKCNPQAEVDGCAADNWYTSLLVADDDDGNLANSTPNACRIYAAFDAHGIACGEPLPCVSGCEPQPFPDAGENREICLGESAQIGTPARPDHTYLWSPGGETAAQITVAPVRTTTYEVTTTTSCGSFSDSVTVFVDDGSSVGLDEEFESASVFGEGGWQTTGLWHPVEETTCVTPSAISGFGAVYFGVDATCDYDTGSRVLGDLISPRVDGVGPGSELSFDFFFEVEDQVSSSFDRLTVAVQIPGDTAWNPVWSRDSTDPVSGGWQSSGLISLAEFAGESLLVRFRFDSVDGSFNRFTGVLLDNVVVTEDVSACDYPPRITVAAPADGGVYENGDEIPFSARAFDREDGNLTPSLVWTSDLSGQIGTGGELTATLPIGAHAITARVVDSNGSPGLAELSIEVVDAAPQVTIEQPADGAEVSSEQQVALRATASDAEDGDLSAQIAWSSNLDGPLGTGGEIAVQLSAGHHLLTAAVTDAAGGLGEATVEVTAVAPPDHPPTVTLTAPVDGTLAAASQPLTFTASAADPEDGDLTASLVWTSDLDGVFGTGGTFTWPNLSVGLHHVRVQATDSAGQTAASELVITVTPDGSPPEVLVLYSESSEDGYLRESAAGSGVGGFANGAGGGTRALRAGDASGDRQYRSIVSFDTSLLPEGAQIFEARLRVRRGRVVGDGDPFGRFGVLAVDLAGAFGGSLLLEPSDFEAPAEVAAVGVLGTASADGEWSEARLDQAGRDAVDPAGRTQLRFGFGLPSDGDGDYDYVGFWSGEGQLSARPQLVITYIEGLP